MEKEWSNKVLVTASDFWINLMKVKDRESYGIVWCFKLRSMLILHNSQCDGEERLLKVGFLFFSICAALFHLSLTSKFALSCQKVFGRGCVGEKRGRQRERACYHINYCFTQSQGAADSRVAAERNTLPTKAKSKVVSSVSCGFAVRNKQKHNVLVGRCAVSCDLIRLCSNAENTEQLRGLLKGGNTQTHTHNLNFSLWATHLSSSRCWSTAAKNEH